MTAMQAARKHVILDLGVVSSGPMLGIEIKTKSFLKNYVKYLIIILYINYIENQNQNLWKY